jgi:hypothetical protein
MARALVTFGGSTSQEGVGTPAASKAVFMSIFDVVTS